MDTHGEHRTWRNQGEAKLNIKHTRWETIKIKKEVHTHRHIQTKTREPDIGTEERHGDMMN